MATPGTDDPIPLPHNPELFPNNSSRIGQGQAQELLADSDRAESAGDLPNGFEVQDPGLRHWILGSSTNLEKELRGLAERAEDLSPEEREFAEFMELKRHVNTARTLEANLCQPEGTLDPRLKKAARYNITRIASIATQMMDTDAGSEHPVAKAMERMQIAPELGDDLAQVRREARDTPSEAQASQWLKTYEGAEETFNELRRMTEDSELEETLRKRAAQAKATRNIKHTWGNTDRTMTENARNAVSEAFEGKGHDDDITAALKLLQIGHGIAAPVIASTLATGKAGIFTALTPIMRSGSRILFDWSTRDRVSAERLPEEVIAERENGQFAIAEAGTRIEGPTPTRIGIESPQGLAPSAEASVGPDTDNAAVQRDKHTKLARRAATELQSTISRMPKTLRGRIAREMRDNDFPEPKWSELAGESESRRSAFHFIAGGASSSNEAAKNLSQALGEGKEIPKEFAQLSDCIMGKHKGRLNPNGGEPKDDTERMQQTTQLLRHLGNIEIAHEQLAQAGRTANRMLNEPRNAELLATVSSKATRLLVGTVKEFAILSVATSHVSHPDMLDCENVSMRTDAVWHRLDTKTRESYSRIAVDAIEHAPSKNQDFLPSMDNPHQARWAAQAGNKLNARLRAIHRELQSKDPAVDPELFAGRDKRKVAPKSSAERE